MRIGTRLTIVLMLCVMPVIAAYTWWSVAQSNLYLNELRQSARAASSGIAPSIDDEVLANEFDKIDDAFRKMDAEGTRGALLRKDGTLWHALPGFPTELVDAARMQLAQTKPAEFGPTAGARNWFCELVPLKGAGGDVIGYLLEVQDWSKVARDSRAQMVASILVALSLLGIVAAVIPAMVYRYVSRPLADLSAKVTKFSASDSDKAAGSEVELLSAGIPQARSATQPGARRSRGSASPRIGTRARAPARGPPRDNRRARRRTRA